MRRKILILLIGIGSILLVARSCLLKMNLLFAPKGCSIGMYRRLVEAQIRLYISLEIALRDKQNQISLPYSILIISLYRKAGVSFMAKTDVEINPSSSCDICRIEIKYLRDEAERKKKAPVDSSLVDDVESLEIDPTPPTPTVKISGASTPIPSTVGSSTSRPPFT